MFLYPILKNNSFSRSALTFIQKYAASQYVASIDQSTTSTKFSVFETNGKLVDRQVVLHQQITLQDGWLQHDPIEILNRTHTAVQNVLNRLSSKQSKDPQFQISKLLGIGVCNQRQTIVCWGQDGKPLHNAIVWCDNRTKEICDDFQKKYGDFKLLTGLPVSTYFSLFKILWLAQNVPEIKEKIGTGKLRFGTIDSWLVYNLTGKYVTDASNASRTHLCNLNGEWDDSLFKLFKFKKQSFPEIVGSFQTVGQINNGPLTGVPISSILGDQQSSAFAHGLQKNHMKITYGTGCFLLANIGDKPETNDSFITTILNKNQQKIDYALQASVQCGGGTLNWAHRTELFNSYNELNNLQNLTHEEIMFYPSFGSIFAPFWKSGVQGTFTGLNFNVTKPQMLQSILQSITFRLFDNIKHQQFKEMKQILVDGGMTFNKFFMQLQADTFNKVVKVRELDTCWGVAKGVLIAQNVQFKEKLQNEEVYKPNPERHSQILKRYQIWCQQRDRIYGW